MAPSPSPRGFASRPAIRCARFNRLAALPNGRAGAGAAPVSVLDRAPASPSAPSTAPGAGDGPPASTPMPVGYLALSVVPVLWGTYNPCIRYLYAEPDALDPASLTAVRTALSAGALLLPALIGYLYTEGRGAWQRYQQQAQAKVHGDEASTGGGDGTFLGGDSSAGVVEEPENSVARPLFSAPINSSRLGPVLTCTFTSVVLGGLELGVLNFLGTALQVEGLHSTSATRAGFLAEITAVLTPVIAYLAGYQVPRAMWLAVAVGLIGSTMVAYDTSQVHDDDGAGAGTAVVQGTPAPPAMAAAAALPVESGAGEGAAAAAAATTSSALGDSALGTGASSAAEAIAALGAADGSSTASYVSTSASAAVDAAQLSADPALGIATEATTAASAVALEVASLAAGAAASTAVPLISDTAAAVSSVAGSAAEVVAAATPLAITGGEVYLLLACLFFSICTIRMGVYAPRMDTVGLAAMKKVGLSSMSLLWMASHNLGNGAALGSIFAFPDLSTRTPLSVAVLVYSGLGPGALATYLQFVGLSTVPATSAQVIFSLTPLCTAWFAWLVLGGETTGPLAWAGGSLIIFAALMAAWAQRQQYHQK